MKLAWGVDVDGEVVSFICGFLSCHSLVGFADWLGFGCFGFDAFVDPGIFVVVFTLVDDLAPVGREVELAQVFGVVAAVAEAIGVGLFGFESDQLSERDVIGFGGMHRSGSMAVFALVTGQMGRGGLRCQPEVYSKPVVWQERTPRRRSYWAWGRA